MPSVVADSALPKSIPAMGMRVGALTATLFDEKGWRRMHVAKWTSVSPTPPPMASKQSRIWPVYVYRERDLASFAANTATMAIHPAIFHGDASAKANSGVKTKMPMMNSCPAIRAAAESMRVD